MYPQKVNVLTVTHLKVCRIAFFKNDEIILLAGKGHEKYQIINGIYHDFNDLKILKNKLIKI